jgi:hypothetical protein
MIPNAELLITPRHRELSQETEQAGATYETGCQWDGSADVQKGDRLESQHV